LKEEFKDLFPILYKYFSSLEEVFVIFQLKNKNLELDLVSDRDLDLKSQLLLYQKESYQML